MKKILFLICSFFISSACIFAQTNLKDTARTENDTLRTANSGFAEEEFRRGVQSYYRGSYNEAIMQFEKALSYLPGENLILDWLGKAYYRAGIEGAAIQQWNSALEAGYGGILLKNKIEIVGERRITGAVYDSSQKYTEAGSFLGMNGKTSVYSQPVSCLTNNDGSFWVACYGSNELLQFDVNGLVIKRVRGPLEGFDRPMDIIRLKSGNLLLSESAGDRLALLKSDGSFIKHIGQKGLGQGQLLGPQYLAEDSEGNIYVTDYGNSRVVVFDSEGNALFTFGESVKFESRTSSTTFAGLESPTGIACVDDRIFVVESVKGSILEFDRAGNYIGKLVNDKTFSRAESLKVWNNYLLVTDKNRIVSVDIKDGSVVENAKTGNGPCVLTCASVDKNGNILVTDFKQNEIYVMSKMTELVGGLFVQIERVISDNFPNVILEVRVENRKRQPVVGLKETNFYISENKRPVTNMQLLGSANNNTFADVTILVDRSNAMQQYNEQLDYAVQEIAKSMNGMGTLRIVSSGKVPVTEYSGSPVKAEAFSYRTLKTAFAPDTTLDLGIRLSANELVNGEKKRAIIYLTSGSVNQNSFTRYGLSDLTAYLNNNSISFSTIMLSDSVPCDEVHYLTQTTLGDTYYVYRPEGISQVIKDIVAEPSGLYQLSFTSALQKEYGRKYLPVEIETYLLNRSGRDESGYFAPLE